MVSRRALVTGYGVVDLLGSVQTSGLPMVLSSTLDSATVASPIANADMWGFIGTQYGNQTNNFMSTSVVLTDGPDGSQTKVLDQFFPRVVSGSTSNYAMPPTGTGIALTSTPLIGAPYTEAKIGFWFRAKSTGVPWGWGAKIPGLGGLKPGASGGVPTGGSPSPNGWSGRFMERRVGTTADANLQAMLRGYFYAPYLPPGAIGNDLNTNKFLVANQWHYLEQYYRMNTVTTEGSTSPPADGIHRIWLDGVLCYENLAQVFRYYASASITHLVWDNFYGGSDVADAPNTWGPVADVHHQFKNLLVLAA